MNFTNLTVILCLVVGYALADDHHSRTVSKRSAKKDSGKEKKDKDKGHGKKENKNHHTETCRVPYETIEDMKKDEADHCFKQEVSPPCHPHERYRRQDGSCNNPHFPTWGKSMTQIIRLAPNTWNDSISVPRKDNKPGTDPQNVRRCRVELLKIRSNPHKKLSVSVMSVGQFGVHDTSFGDPLPGECCPIATENQDVCWSIDIPPGDEIFNDNNGCIPLNRIRTTRDTCQVEGGPLQINRNTPIFDLDTNLGRDLETSKQLRNLENGSLLSQWIKNKHGQWGEYLLQAEDVERSCPGNHPDETICFRTSDERVNQNPWLTVLHTVFLREFNRIVKYLHKINPHWDGEKVYQEARQIIIAEWQKIIAYDWLPYVIGETTIQKCGLDKPKHGQRSRHEEKLHPVTTVFNNFIAMRELHSIIPNHVCLDHSPSNHDNCNHKILLKDWFNRSGIIPDNFDGVIHSLSFQSVKKNDYTISDAIGNRLFKLPPNEYGQDLRAIDMQRSIEVGVGTYNDLREFCELPRIESFDEFSKFGSDVVEILQECYNSPDDIDGIIGTTRLEDPLPDAVVGPSSACIIAEQFKRWRFGDSWWYDGELNRNRFTDKQIMQFQEKVSLARIFCDNSNDIKKIQPNVFVVPGEGNDIVPCESLPSLNLNLWKEGKDSDDSDETVEVSAISSSGKSSSQGGGSQNLGNKMSGK